tara:strand:- start:163 stop:348 length:186 start_codon:yes stop_codon:yes gene_type:complete
MALGEVRKRTITMYDKMIKYYKNNIGEISEYGNTVITEDLIKNIEKRRSELSETYDSRWVR